MEEIDIGFKNFKDTIYEKSLIGWSKKTENAKKSIFGAFLLLSDWDKKNSTASRIYEKISQILLSIIIFLQIVRFNWTVSFETGSSIDKHWRSLGYSSMTQICAEAGGLYSCCTSLWFITSLIAIMALCLAVMVHQNRRIDPYLILIPKIIFYYLTTIGFIPSVVISMLGFKYSAINQDNVSEYQACTNCNLNLGGFGVFMSSITLILLLLFAYGYEICSAELRHTFASINLKARAHSDIDFAIIKFSFASAVVYVLTNQNSNYFHQTILVFYSAHILYKTIKNPPYYNAFSNSIIICRQSGIIFITLAFIFGDIIDDPLIIIWFFWLINPILIFIAFYYAMKTFKNAGKNENWLLDQYKFELHFRHSLVAGSSSESSEMIKYFDQAYKTQFFKVDKLFLIWETNYYIYTLQNERLARLKFRKIFYLSSNNVEASYQEWLIARFFEKKNIGVHEDISTIYYLLELENIKTKDRYFCNKLIDFWNEVVTSSPKIERLNLLSKKVSENLDVLDAGYSNLVKKFPNRIACHSLYGSLQADILKREESGAHLIQKKESLLSLQHQENQNKSLSFSDSNGFLVISANESTFGTIVYADSIVSLILNQDINSIIGSKYYAYIPEYFAKNHDKHLENCIENNKNLESSLFFIHFIMTARGSLVECACEAHLIPLIQETYFVAVMQPISKMRECALILKDGTICAHSERFLNFIQSPKISGNNENIDELIPNLNFSSLKSHDSVLIHYSNKPILFVLINTTTKSTIFNLLLLIHDKNEIEEWNQGKDAWQQDLAEKCPRRFQKINFNENNAYKEIEYEEKNGLENRESLIKEENKISERINSNTLGSSHSSMSFSSIGKKMKRNAQATLSWIKWALLASILMIITMTCGILLYIWKEISHSNEIESVENLAGLLHEMTIMAHLARAIDLSTNYLDLNTSFYLSSFSTSVNSLDSLQNTILSDYDSWSYCSSSNIVKNEIIPIWNIWAIHPLQYYTLYDAMALFVKHVIHIQGKSFLDAYISNSDYKGDELFLIANGLGDTYKVLSSSVKGYLKCETDRVKNDDSLILLLLLMDGFLLVSLSFGMILLIIQFHRAYNGIWNFIRKQSNDAYIELFHSCIDRLSTVHCCIPDQQEIRKKCKGIEKPINENFSKRFAASLSIIIICFGFCVWSIADEYNASCKANLIKRYELLEAYYIRVSQISEACYWVCELSIGKNETTEDIFDGIYEFPNANHMIIDVTDRYTQTLHITSNLKYRELFSNNLHKSFFEKVPNALDHIFDFGTYYGSMIMKNEFTFYAYSNDSNIPKEINRFLFQAGTLQSMIKSKTPVFNKGSRDFVDAQFKIIVYVMICFAISSLLAYFLLYLPMIVRENHKLQKLYEISQLIPSTNNKK